MPREYRTTRDMRLSCATMTYDVPKGARVHEGPPDGMGNATFYIADP